MALRIIFTVAPSNRTLWMWTFRSVSLKWTTSLAKQSSGCTQSGLTAMAAEASMPPPWPHFHSAFISAQVTHQSIWAAWPPRWYR